MPNRLATETSPYLRQHADNPVDWYPWGEEAFAAARDRDRPILLSVGYSACHWCHVMAHESFEDPAIAGRMNELFVNVKVDREERPDVDAIYMEAVQAMSGRGGWPMTVFLTPDGRPFFGGTYFPDRPRHGMTSFPELLERIDEVWTTRRPDIDAQADELTDAIRRAGQLPAGTAALGPAVLHEARGAIASAFDRRYGGFGHAPKFPQAMTIDLLLRTAVHGDAGGGDEARAMADASLRAMARGGIYDHLGGGFARYSTDEEWLAPHFEKMLYDNALLTRAYLHAWQVTGDPEHRQVLDETVGYVLRDLTHPDGGFYSAEDADSEGEEGRFYVWTEAEARAVLAAAGLAPADVETALAWYDVTPRGNWEGHAILRRLGDGPLTRPPAVEAARAALLAARAARVRPGLDDKVLLEWNGLMLAALAEAAAVTGDPGWRAAAVANGEFLLARLRRADGRWLRSWQGPHEAGAAGRAQHLAYAADHAALVDAFTRLGELTGEARWTAKATATAEALVALFWDDEHGGVHTTGSDAEALVTRPKDLTDNATPSANSLTALAFLRLGALTGRPDLIERAEAVLRLLAPVAGRHALGFGHLLVAADLSLRGTTEVVITGDRPDLVAAVQQGPFRPEVVLAWGERSDSPLWEGRDEEGAAGRAYVCRGGACDLPVGTVDDLTAQLARA